MTEERDRSVVLFVVFPGVAMLLGWGLRGYIGGGPYGAMIPGCFVALTICLLLDYKMETAAMAALFGAIGIGMGGNMTYGQTLGFLHEPETLGWGVLGCTVKGGVWGLLGGALLGVGLSRDRYSRKDVIIGLLLMVAAFHLGRELINEPKLIYFSNLEDRPRDESWAGMLFGAITLLAYLRLKADAAAFRVPLKLALFGGLGGAIGFGGGCLFLAFGPPIKWIGWWKMMEFTFGLIFGAALGLGAYTVREELKHSGQNGEMPPPAWKPVIFLVGLILGVFSSYAVLSLLLPEDFLRSDSMFAFITRKGIGMALSYAFIGALVLIIGLHSLHAAWQAAITLTFFHTVLDYTRDLDEVKNFGFVCSAPVQWLVNLTLALLLGFWVYKIQAGSKPVLRLLLLAVWACFAAACARSFLNLNFFNAPEGLSYMEALMRAHPAMPFVHGTFTVSAVITTYFAMVLSKKDL
jgi:hypothetical protein